MEIMLPQKVKLELREEFKVSKVTLWKALNGKSDSAKARMLRKAALERGGKVYEGRVCKGNQNQ